MDVVCNQQEILTTTFWIVLDIVCNSQLITL